MPSIYIAFCPWVVCCALVFCLFIADAEENRTWTSSDGKTLTASLVNADRDGVLLRLKGGREARIPLQRLSEADQAFIARMMKSGKAFAMESMPDETQAPRELDVSGGPRIFQTPHFEFETDQDVLRGFIAEAARVYEGTYYALNGLPLGLEFSPGEGKSHFRGRFMNDSAFDSIANSKMPSIPGQRVVGLYLGEEQELLVPYSSLGAMRRGDRLTLRKSSDTTTLIHEIVHQVMHEWLPVIPTWFSEGMAEYISAIPYQNGRFEFKSSERGLKERLKEKHRIAGNTISGVKPPSEYLERYLASGAQGADESGKESPNAPRGIDLSGLNPAGRPAGPDGWTGNVSEYRDSMLTVYFFMHLYDPQNQGAPVGAYLRMVDAAMGDTDKVKSALKDFEKDRLAYNEDVKRYNAELDIFQKTVDEYNRRVTLHNDQLKNGVPKDERIEIGEEPKEPVPPKGLKVPESIKKASVGGNIDLAAMVKRSSLPGLLQGRDLSELDAAMKSAFAEMGIEIDYR